MRAALHGLDQGDFTEGYELDRKWKVAKEMVGRRLSQEEAKRLSARFDWENWIKVGSALSCRPFHSSSSYSANQVQAYICWR